MITFVMCHGDPVAEDAIRRHIGSWRANAGSSALNAFCPANKKLSPSVASLFDHVVYFGQAQHHGEESVDRFKYLLAYAVSANWGNDSVLIHEYDSILNEIPVVTAMDVCGIVHRDVRPNRGFKGTTFIHPPLIFGADALRWVVTSGLLSSEEQGFWDRWLGYVVEKPNSVGTYFSMVNLVNHKGFSRNTIEKQDLPAMRDAVAKGAVAFHGVKGKEASEVALRKQQ